MLVNNKVKEEKSTLREAFKDKRRTLDNDKKADYDADIQSRVLSLREYAAAETIFTYVSMNTEVSTLGIIYAAWANGKRVAVPRTERDSNEMAFYYLNSLDELTQSYYGIREPDPDRSERALDTFNGLCIVPGLAFDADGYRLGYGKGCYDRFLKGFRGVSVGLCYSGYVKWKLPRGAYDVPVEIIVTERYLRHTNV